MKLNSYVIIKAFSFTPEMYACSNPSGIKQAEISLASSHLLHLYTLSMSLTYPPLSCSPFFPLSSTCLALPPTLILQMEILWENRTNWMHRLHNLPVEVEAVLNNHHECSCRTANLVSEQFIHIYSTTAKIYWSVCKWAISIKQSSGLGGTW